MSDAAQTRVMPVADVAERQRAQAVMKRLDRFAKVTDTAIPLPGGRSIGLDGIIGLVPGIGDVIGAVLSGYVVVEAARLGVPRRLLARMLGNVGVEMIVGLIPVLGDVFDFLWKSNQRNVGLLREEIDRRLGPPPKPKPAWRYYLPWLAVVTPVLLLIGWGLAQLF